MSTDEAVSSPMRNSDNISSPATMRPEKKARINPPVTASNSNPIACSPCPSSPIQPRPIDECKISDPSPEYKAHIDQKDPLHEETWSAIQSLLSGRKLALFLDYDGTLTPIVSNPDMAILSPEMRDTISSTSRKHTVAIVTGRKLATIKKFVQLDELFYAASHGYDIEGPRDYTMKKQVAVQFLPDLQAFAEHIQEKINNIPGCTVENNLYCISVHYRNVDPGLVPQVEARVDEVLCKFGTLKKGHGKMVYEVKPDYDWDKGKAVQFLMSEMFDQPDGIVPLYLGDDVADEQAFKALRTHFNLDHVSICIRDIGDLRPSIAKYKLPQARVRDFLTKLVQL